MAKTGKKAPPPPIEASPEARKAACAVLEVLSGLKGPSEAAGDLAVSLNRYYVLETRALEGLVKALEPRPKGRAAPTVENQLALLTRERDRLRAELERSRALVRMAHRTVGLSGDRGKARKKRGNRARKVLSRLRGDGKEGKAAS